MSIIICLCDRQFYLFIILCLDKWKPPCRAHSMAGVWLCQEPWFIGQPTACADGHDGREEGWKIDIYYVGRRQIVDGFSIIKPVYTTELSARHLSRWLVNLNHCVERTKNMLVLSLPDSFWSIEYSASFCTLHTHSFQVRYRPNHSLFIILKRKTSAFTRN